MNALDVLRLMPRLESAAEYDAALDRVEAELARLEAHITALTQEGDEWERIAAERGTRMDEIQARAEAAEAALAESESKLLDALEAENTANLALADTQRALADARQERDAAMEELESAESEDGSHFCLTTEREWRPCPPSLCEADKLVDQNRKLRGVWLAEKEARFLEVNAHHTTIREGEAMANAFEPMKGALIALAFDSPVDEGLCWCPDYWWHDEETGAREEEHSKQCLAARRALAVSQPTGPTEEQT